MAPERLYLFDTTLRDGAQTNGVDFTLGDKLTIAKMLDDLGIDYVEGGYPGANPTDTELFAEDRKLGATFTAFGMTRRPGRSTSNDPGLAALLGAKADAICFVAKSWDYHVRVALETTPEENLASIRDSVAAAVAKGREVLLDCEHFFDGYKANPQFALACAKAAYDAGARWVVLCDTNGGALPHEVETIVSEVVKARARTPRGDGPVRITDLVVGDGRATVPSNTPVTITVDLDADDDRKVLLHLGITEGPAAPIIALDRRCTSPRATAASASSSAACPSGGAVRGLDGGLERPPVRRADRLAPGGGHRDHRPRRRSGSPRRVPHHARRRSARAG